MSTSSRIHKKWFILIATAFLALLLAGCGAGATEFTYRVTGTASEATIKYTNADGEVEEATVSLPWEKTLTLGNKFSFELTVINQSGSGTVTCEALVDGEVLGEADGNTSVSCFGHFSKKGSSLTSAFSSAADTVAPPATPTPIASPTPSASEHVALAMEYAEQGQLDEAIAEFQTVIELEPDNPDAYRNLGTAYGEQGKWEEAAAAYEQAISLDPDFGEAYGDLAGAYAMLGRLSEAIAAGEKAIELAPDYAMAHNNLGTVYAEQGMPDEAIAEYQEAIRLDPYNAMARNNLGFTYYEQGRLDEAIAEYQEAIRINPDHALAHINLGLAYRDLGQLDEAIAELETYLQLRPDAPDRAAVEQEIAKLKRPAVELAAEYGNAAGGYSLRYPEGWYYEESETQVQFAESEEALASTTLEAPMVMFIAGPVTEIAESLGLTEITDPAETLEAIAKKLKSETGEIETGQVAGYPAALTDISGTLEDTPYNGGLVVYLVEKRVIYGAALAPPDQWEVFRPTFVAMLNSLSFFEP